MYRHDRLDPAVILRTKSEIIKIDRDQSRLPVMTVDDIRPEINNRQGAQHCLGKEGKLLNIRIHIAVRRESIEIIFIIYKIE